MAIVQVDASAFVALASLAVHVEEYLDALRGRPKDAAYSLADMLGAVELPAVQAILNDPSNAVFLPVRRSKEEWPITVARKYQEAEAQVFPTVPDDQVWCQLRNRMVGTMTCATDECGAPEQRPVCWNGRMRGLDDRG